MKKWMSWVLLATVVFLGSTNVLGQRNGSGAPALRVICNVLMAEIRINGNLPSGEHSVVASGKPVPLKKGESYTLIVTKPGYVSYRKSFAAAWNGVKEKSVMLEKGIGPAEGQPWIAELEDGVVMEFMPVPAGEFMMGSDEGDDDERPVHRVEFTRPFWMAKTEVTNQQYEQFKAVNHKPEENEIVMPKGAVYPVCYISWNDAQDFCKWLTKKERRRGRLPEGYEYALPTEAEWEYACRAGTTEAYAGSVDAMAWHTKNSAERTNPVGQKKPNAWGLLDMHGNVWEWCADEWYASYSNAPTAGSQRGDAYDEYGVDRLRMDEPENAYRLHSPWNRVVRGGSWHYSAMACRSANRFYHEPDFSLNYLGFRPVILWNPPPMRLKATTRLKEGL